MTNIKLPKQLKDHGIDEITYRKWFEVAKENGINRSTFKSRLFSSGWDIEKAATTKPTKKKVISPFWLEMAKENGISINTFKSRVRRGWDQKEAASQLPRRRKDRKWIELAKKNGIPYQTYINRVENLFWDPKDAATSPIVSPEEVREMAIESRKTMKSYEDKRLYKDKSNLFKLTPHHLEDARKNGISKNTVHTRVYYLGWTVQEATTIPPRKMPDEYYHYLEIAKSNNISPNTFRKRINSYGWTYEEAASRKPIPSNSRKRTDKDWIEKAIKNGIDYHTYIKRVENGWTYKEAATIQPLPKGKFLNEERKRNSAEGFKKFKQRK